MRKRTIPIQRHTLFHYLFTVLYIFGKNILSSIAWVGISIGGYFIFQTKQSPFNYIFGIPLFLIGIGLSINAIQSILLSITSLRYNEDNCPLCHD